MFSGFTDNKGTQEYNLSLSTRRAESVGMYLVDNFGIDPIRIVPQWYGMAAPVAGNGTEERQHKNRRFETIVAELP